MGPEEVLIFGELQSPSQNEKRLPGRWSCHVISKNHLHGTNLLSISERGVTTVTEGYGPRVVRHSCRVREENRKVGGYEMKVEQIA